MVTMSEEEYLAHYGTQRHSGRYPWGSGDEENGATQRHTTLLAEIENTKKTLGIGDTAAAKLHGITTTQLRDIRTNVRKERLQDEIHMARKLKYEAGMSNVAIAKEMSNVLGRSIGDTQVGNLLRGTAERKGKILDNVTETLRKAVEEKEYLDVGSGTEFQLDITSTKLRAALQQLKDEGYMVHPVKVEQLGTGKQTNMRVLTKPGTTWSEAQRNRDKIQQLTEYSTDGGMTSLGMLPPLSIKSSRVGIKYAEEGGKDADGVMYVRRGVKDVSLGKAPYAQVRVMVDGSHYIKGMAIYKDDLPDGVDILFNTNKSNTGNKLDALKEITKDPDNPFGATVRQIGKEDHTGKITELTSAMNLVNKEGDWEKWSKSLSSQMLSKQPPSLAKEQLDLTYTKKKSELDGILALTNPSVKRKLLEAYADGTDSSAIHLKAAHLPRQANKVILPVPEMKPGEVYAPTFRNGERVVLVRFPHGGTFEIPELVVNNKNPAGIKLLGPHARDAIGIHPKVAERLSGADFDGDSVLVIPNTLGKVKTTSALLGLKNFEPKESYPYYEGMKVMTSYEKGLEMGKISNLITDMTIQRASTDEIARAVRHSMVVIDAEKHKLDFKRSYQANGIRALTKKYQPESPNGGAATLISRATSRKDVYDRKLRSAAQGGPIDRKTGQLVYVETGKMRTRTDKKGNIVETPSKIQTTKLGDTNDAHTLSSGTVIEKLYGDHSNKLKALANQARRELVQIKSAPYSPSAKRVHVHEVETLNAKLALALRNAPRERQAQVIANATVKMKVQENPSLRTKEGKAEYKRVKSQALSAARIRTEAVKNKFEITDSEWAAIQAGAITAHKLDQILTYADLKRIKELATPRAETKMTPNSEAKARALQARGYTLAEIAESLGVSTSTISRAIGGDED